MAAQTTNDDVGEGLADDHEDDGDDSDSDGDDR